MINHCESIADMRMDNMLIFDIGPSTGRRRGEIEKFASLITFLNNFWMLFFVSDFSIEILCVFRIENFFKGRIENSKIRQNILYDLFFRDMREYLLFEITQFFIVNSMKKIGPSST